MSDSVFVKFHSEKADFENVNAMVQEIIRHALSSGYAVRFHDAYIAGTWGEKIAENTFTISDSFLYSQADELLDVTSFAYDTEEEYKRKFLEKYRFFNSLFDILFAHGISEVELYILTNNEGDLAACIPVKTSREEFLETLFRIFLERAPQMGYTFPCVKLQVENAPV